MYDISISSRKSGRREVKRLQMLRYAICSTHKFNRAIKSACSGVTYRQLRFL